MSDTDEYVAVISRLQSLANPINVAGMARFGINPQKTLGISVAVLRSIAKDIGKNQALSERLWQSQIHEARIIAAYVGIPSQVRAEQMERWAGDFESWDICDQCCSNLFAQTPYAYSKALEWSSNEQEYVKRAAYSLMASLAVKEKKVENDRFEPFFQAIIAGSTDQRNFVKKAVNWALRQIGKRDYLMNQKAIAIAREIQQINSPAAHWVAADALRELASERVQSRLKNLRASVK
jgi:3-methyladenine DNA glycosylase AlkD